MPKTFNLSVPIPRERIADLLCSALEGGSNYWYMVVEKVEPKAWTWETVPTFATREEAEACSKHYLHYYPFNEGGALLINDENADEPELKTPVRLDWERIAYGLSQWVEDAMKPDEDKTRTAHPFHLADFIKGNEDNETADVFLQYCIFGKVIYG